MGYIGEIDNIVFDPKIEFVIYPCEINSLKNLDKDTHDFIMSNSQFLCFHKVTLNTDIIREIKQLLTFNEELKIYVEQEETKIANKITGSGS